MELRGSTLPTQEREFPFEHAQCARGAARQALR